MNDRSKKQVVVVGAGITGLAAAWELSKSGQVHVTVIDKDDRVGGKISSNDMDLDAGPDGFIARGAPAIELCNELGLSEDLVSPKSSGAFILTQHKLQKLPGGLFMGIPSNLRSIALSKIISYKGLVRAALDLLRPATSIGDDISVYDFIASRLGVEICENLVEPLLGGIHAGNAHQLSMKEVAPFILNNYKRSLIMDLSKIRSKAPSPPGPAFTTVKGGLYNLPLSLYRALVSKNNVTFMLGTQALRAKGSTLTLDNSQTVQFDSLLLATPAWATKNFVNADIAARLNSISYASVGVVSFEIPRIDLPEATGFLVPPREGYLITAATWLSNKWPYFDNSKTYLRASIGKIDNTHWQELSDSHLIDQAYMQLRQATLSLGVELPVSPRQACVTRWVDALPQYNVGHRKLIEAISPSQGVFLAGAYLNGVGVPACIESGREAARTILDTLDLTPTLRQGDCGRSSFNNS